MAMYDLSDSSADIYLVIFMRKRKRKCKKESKKDRKVSANSTCLDSEGSLLAKPNAGNIKYQEERRCTNIIRTKLYSTIETIIITTITNRTTLSKRVKKKLSISKLFIRPSPLKNLG